MQKVILVVDDRVINREFLTTLLGYAGYRVLEASDGAQALDMIRREQPALVISDVLMPVMDGIEFANRLHADLAIAHTPVIFYTATYRLSEARVLAANCGVAAVLAKPAEPQVILDAVAAALGIESTQVEKIEFPSTKISPFLPETAGLQLHLQKVIAADVDAGASADLGEASMYTMGKVQTLSLRLAALLELNITLSLERDAQRLLDLFCRGAQDIMNAKSAAISMRGNGQIRRFACYGMTAMEADAIFDTLAQRLASQQTLGRRFLIVPVLLGSHAHGWFYLADKLGAEVFSDEDEEFAETLAAQLAPLYENLCLYDEVRQHAGQLEIEILERKLVTDKLQESEAGLRRAQEMARLAHVITGPDGVFEKYSETLPHLIGVDVADIPLTTRDWLNIVHPSDRERFLDCCIQAGKSGARMEVEYRVLCGDGTCVELHQMMEPLLGRTDAQGKMRWFNSLQDVTEQKEQQRKIDRLSRISAVLSGVNSAIVRIHDHDALFKEACRIAVSEGTFGMAWVGLLDPDTRDGQVVACMGGKPGYAEKIRFTALANTPNSDCPACVAVREMMPVICNDIRTEPTLASLREELLGRGHLSVAAFPLLLNNQVEGVIVLFGDEANMFDEEELKLLNELAGDISFGLQFIDKEKKLSYLAYYDPLTELPNSMLFHDRLTQFLHGSKHEARMASVILFNLDHFSQLNDVLGRHVGDLVLRQVAERLGAFLIEPYSLARISNDIFAVAVPDLQQAADAATILEQQIFDAFDAAFIVDQHEIRLTVRAGLAMYPEDGDDAETLFKHAEAALKETKSSEERYLYYAPQMNTTIASKLVLERELRVALNQRQFVLHYQPRVDLLSGRIIGAEALIRWQHPQRGMVPPLLFIPLAEETGLIEPIGAWVIEEVCAQQAAWLAQQVALVPVAVNLSAVQFKKGAVLHTICDTIERHQLDQKYIEFELTESVVMHDPEEAAAHLQALKKLGIKLSLDDFGTGFSSLAYLKRFPFDFVKIDRTFVTDITTKPEDAVIATAVIAMAHSLGLRVIAEGVETEGQLRYLRQHHCDEMQGYYFSPPVPAAAFEAMLCEEKHLVLEDEVGGREHTLLIVDDEPNNLAALKRALSQEGWRLLTANSGEEGLELLALNSVQVILSDQRMPGMSGAQFLSIVKQLYPNTIRIILSGYIDLEAATDSVNRGAVFRILSKPWNDDFLRENIRDAFRRYHT